VDDIHQDLLQYVAGSIHQQAEELFEKYIQAAHLPDPIYKQVADHLRKQEQTIHTQLTQLSIESTPYVRVPLTQKFAQLATRANQSTTNIQGRGGPTPPPAGDLPPLLQSATPPPNQPLCPTSPQTDVDAIVAKVYDKIRSNPGRGLE
jgi:hypothetical protein